MKEYLTASVRHFFCAGNHLLASLDPFGQERLFGLDFRQLQGFTEVAGGNFGMIQPRLEFAQDGVEQVIGLQ